MMKIVTLEMAKDHLRIDEITHELSIYITAAEELAQEFLNRRVYDVSVPEDDPTGIVANSLITAAILLILGHLYENRETVTDKPLNNVPMGALSLLQPYRIEMGV